MNLFQVLLSLDFSFLGPLFLGLGGFIDITAIFTVTLPLRKKLHGAHSLHILEDPTNFGIQEEPVEFEEPVEEPELISESSEINQTVEYDRKNQFSDQIKHDDHFRHFAVPYSLILFPIGMILLVVGSVLMNQSQ